MIEDELVILVDSEDREIGYAAKLEAHQKGLLHRAISVCLVDEQGRMLLQKRAASKYHSGGLWTNACCTHPRRGESVGEAASRRLNEELGISCKLGWILSTEYKAPVSNGLIENEVVHLFFGTFNGMVSPNLDEVETYEWVGENELRRRIDMHPDNYTYWFKYYIERFAPAMFSGIAA